MALGAPRSQCAKRRNSKVAIVHFCVTPSCCAVYIPGASRALKSVASVQQLLVDARSAEATAMAGLANRLSAVLQRVSTLPVDEVTCFQLGLAANRSTEIMVAGGLSGAPATFKRREQPCGSYRGGRPTSRSYKACPWPDRCRRRVRTLAPKGCRVEG